MLRRFSRATRATLMAAAAMPGFASVSAVFAQSAVEVAAADAGPAASAAPQAAATEKKRLFSVPEDGSGENEVVAPRIVRELMSLRPKEDLIVCIAGCSPGRDRVIYSQPVEETLDGKSVSNLVPATTSRPSDRGDTVTKSQQKPSGAAGHAVPAIDLPKGAVADDAPAAP